MSINCSKCGSRNTKIVPWKDLEANLNEKQKQELLAYGQVKLDPKIIIELIKAIVALTVAALAFFTERHKNRNKNEDKKYVVCVDCGHTQEV